MSEVLYLPFDEQRDSIFPQDEQGNGQAALLVAAGSIPTVVDQRPFGNGRQFDATNIFVIEDSNAAGSTREVGAYVLAEVDYASIGVGATAYLLAHGEVTGGNTRYDWALRVEVLSASGVARVRAVWHDDTGALVVPDGLLVQLPTAGEILLGFTRFQDSGTIKVRYSAGDRFSGDIESPAADVFDIYTAIDNADSRLWVAGTDDGAGAVASAFHGVITNAVVVDNEVAAQEPVLLWKSLTVLAEQARATWNALGPRNVYSRNPDENVNSERRVEAGAYAYMKGTLSEVESFFLDTAFGSFLSRWESILRISPQPTDSIAERRERALSHTKNVLGYSKASIQLQLRELFGFALDSQVEILESDSTHTEAWSTDQTENWLLVTGAATPAHDGGGGTLEIDRPGPGAADMRYKGLAANGVGGVGASMAMFPVGDRLDPDNYLIASADVTAFSQTGAEKVVAGIAIGDKVNDDWLFLGIGEMGGGLSDELAYWRWTDGAADGNGVVILDGFSLPITLSIRYRNGVYLLDGDDSSISASVTVFGPLNPGWVALVLAAPNDQATNGTTSANIDNVSIIDRNGRQRNNWYAYRDPALLATPYSLDKAQKVIERIEPATTRGKAIDRQGGLNCDDATSLTSRDFIGSISGGS